jgi:predicted transposase/invertase (TIGR01784 family)
MSEEEGPVHQGNDKLFKVAFSDPLNTAALLRSELPPAIADAVDWEQLKILPGSFIDSQFRTSETDLLFSAAHHEHPCFFYLLFEHQTKLDPWISLKLLRYKSRIWEDYRKQNPEAEKLPLIFPMVLAQNRTIWKVSTRFSALIDIPLEHVTDYAPYIPEFEYHLIQLAEKSYETIHGTATGVLILRAMKAGRLGELLHQALWDETLLSEVPERIYEMVLRYILGHDIDKDAFKSRVHNISNPNTRSTAMTLAQQFRQEGLQEGLQEGRQEGFVLSRQQDVLEVLEIRFGLIPEGLKEAVESIQEEDRLRALHRTAVQCADVESFAKHL